MNLNKNLIALALTTALTACGGSSNSSTDTQDNGSTPEVTETIITGKAIKGVLNNAIVTVYKFVDGKPVLLTDAELKDADIITNDKGTYTFTLLDYNGPIKIQLSPSKDPLKPTTMSCDAADGCGDIKFGKPIDLTAIDPNFKLDAISIVDSTSNGEVKVNVSALTHLAATLIEASDAGITADSVASNSAKIASTFDIKGDITKLEPTVADDASAVAGEDNEAELRYGRVNAGIMSALFSGETDGTDVLSSKLAEVAIDLVASKGEFLFEQDDEDAGFELALDDITEGSSKVHKLIAEIIAKDDSLTSTIDLVQLETQLANEHDFKKANVGDDGFVKVVVDVLTEGDAVAKAKAMVGDVRLFSHLFNDETTEGAGIKTQGDEYVALLETAGTMVEAEAESFELIAQLSDALSTISTAYDEGTITKAAAAAGINIATYIDGATGSITFEEETAAGGILFKVDATSGSEKAQLNVSAEFSEDKKNITLTIDGLVESAGAKFTLNEGSFAQINVDTAASREALDNDTYEGKVISGELELALSLAQKPTDLVPNPVTFEGMVKTKLLAVGERVLGNEWESTPPRIETIALPEMLSLSGEFSSSEADSIKATLTVNINNLDGHQAPDFKHIGKEIPNAFTMTISDDLNTIITTAGAPVKDGFESTRVFVPGEAAGNFSYTKTSIPIDVTTHPIGDSFVRNKAISSTFTVGNLDKKGLIYGTSTFAESDETNFGAISFKLTPVDINADDITDHFDVRVMGTRDGIEPRSAYTPGNILNDKGELEVNGVVREFTDNTIQYDLSSIEDVMYYYSQYMTVSPFETSTATQFYTSTIENKFHNQISVTITDEGRAAVYFDEDDLEAIRTGNHSGLPASAYITQPLIKDALTMEVSADANTVTGTLGSASRVTTFAFTGEGNSLGNFESLETITAPNYLREKKVWSQTKDENNGLDYPTVLLSVDQKNIDHENEYQEKANQFKMTAIDDDDNNITDYLLVTKASGDHFNDQGVLVNEDGSEAEFVHIGEYSYDENSNYPSLFAYNPLTLGSALELTKARIMFDKDAQTKRAYIDGIGLVEVELSSEDIDSILVNSTTTFDGYNIQADSSRTSLEDEDTFLKVNAALTLEAMLGDYQVKLQLSGKRTTLEGGAFDLDMSYRLPGAETQRSFTAHYNTEVEGRLTANNADGVRLVLNEKDEDEDATGTQVLGQILVGPTAIVAATIEDRDGIVVVVYSDETTETL